MKKLSALALSFTMAATLAACSGGQTKTAEADQTSGGSAATAAAGGQSADHDDGGLKPEAGAKLLVWESKDERPFVEQMISEFKAKYNVDVLMEEVGAADQVTKLTNDGPAGIAADVVLFPHDQLGRAATAGLILPNDVFANASKQENSEQAVHAVSYQNKLYGYPRSVETYAMFYNKDMVPKPPKTFDEVFVLAKTLNDSAKNQYAYLWEIDNFYFAYPFLATTGGYVFGKNGTDKNDIGLNNEGAVKGATIFAKLHSDKVVPMASGDITYDIKKGLFTGGTLGMNIDGPWAIGDIKKSGIKFGVATIPSIDGKPSVSFSGVKAWYVNAFSKYPNAAKLFARFASNKDAQLKDFKATGALPANKEAQNDPAVKGDEVVSGFLEQFKNSYPMPSIPEMASIWDPGKAALSDIWNKGADPKQALDNAVKQIHDSMTASSKN